MNNNSLQHYTISLIKHYRFYFLCLMMIAILAGYFSISVEYKIKEIIDTIASDSSAPLLGLLLMFVLYKFLHHGMFFIERLFAIRYMPRILESTIMDIYTQTIRHSLHWFDSQFSGEISKKIFDFQEGISSLVSQCFSILNVCATIVLTLVFLSFVNTSAAAVILGFILVYTPIIWFLLKHQLKFYHEKVSASQKVVGIVNDSISNIFGVKVIGNAANEREANLRPALVHWKNRDKKTRQFDAFAVDNADTLLITIMTAIQIFLLASLFQQGEITAGGFAFIAMMTLKVHSHLDKLLSLLLFEVNPSLAQIKSAHTRLYAPIDVQDQLEASKLQAVKGGLRYNKVTFAYNDRSSTVLRDFCLDIQPGEQVGIVGTSGAGKSTLIKCLLRYFDIQQGSIHIDGIDITTVTQESLRESLSVIPQDISMFHRSIIDNLRLAKPNASAEDIEQACAKARIHDDILQMPDSYNTIVGERGVKLSGGQRQRIAIARAILKNAPILILDEATSSLDTTTEHLIQESINDMLESSRSTVIAIAHRLSTLKHMDRIVVMDKGQIIEQGTHDELIQLEGAYKTLWDMQLI